jgi:hypothetical protein
VGANTNRVTPYEHHRGYVLGVLARRCRWLDPEDMHAREVRAYLTQTAVNKALNERQRAERRLTVPFLASVRWCS